MPQRPPAPAASTPPTSTSRPAHVGRGPHVPDRVHRDHARPVRGRRRSELRSAAGRRRRGDAWPVPGARRRRGRHAAAVGEGARRVGARQRGPTPRRGRALRGHHRRAAGLAAPGADRAGRPDVQWEMGAGHASSLARARPESRPTLERPFKRREDALGDARAVERGADDAARVSRAFAARDRGPPATATPASPRSRSKRTGALVRVSAATSTASGNRKPGIRAPMRAQARRAAPRRRTAAAPARRSAGASPGR